jgi:hypothetical protein
MDDLKDKVLKWAGRIGREEAERRLKAVGVSKSTIEKLLAGSYSTKKPKPLLSFAIESAMKKGA